MKAAVYRENGPPSVFTYEDVPEPVCDPHGIVMRNMAISIEGGDTLSRLAMPPTETPHIVGYQSAGEVIEIGANVRHLRVGDRVTAVHSHGSHAELRAVPARNAWRIPADMDINLAAAIPIPFGTADECLFEFGQLMPGQSVLIQAGASALGLAAIQLAKRAGATVLATASSDGKLARLREFGVDFAVNYRTEDLVRQVRKFTDKQGVNLVVDPVGTTMRLSVACLSPRGRAVLVGRAGREPVLIDPGMLMAGNQSITGVWLGAEMATDRVHDMIQRHVNDVATGKLVVVIDSEFPLSHAQEAHAHIERRQAFGRVLLIP